MSLTDDDRSWILAELGKFYAELGKVRADIERVETSLLTEFHKWASPAEARLRTHTAALRAIDLELEAVSERVTNLEGRQH